MQVVFCVKDEKGRYKVTAYGDLEGIPEGDRLRHHLGRQLSFTIRQEFGDAQPFADRLPVGDPQFA